MTREVAKEILQEQIDRYGQEYDAEGIEALKVAIEVLGQEPSGDCISRKAVEKITWDWENFKTKLNQEGLNVLKEVREKVADLPPITPQPKTDGDYISRKELLKALDTWDKYGYTETGCFVRDPKNDYVPYIHYDDVIKCIKGMPPVTPQPKTGHWIPVSEALPPRDENVLTYHRNESFDYQYVSWIDDYSGKWAGFIGNLSDEVLAWMPLPPSYQGEEE